MEIVSGLWLGNTKQIENIQWCKEKKIQMLINCGRQFEVEQPIDLNYVYLDKIDEFSRRAAERLYKGHYLENKNCLVVCENGRRIALLVVVYLYSKVCSISRERAFQIIKTKLPVFKEETYITRFIKGQ